MTLPAALAPLGERRRWIVAQLVPLVTGKTDKRPLDYRTGSPANAHDPNNWLDYATARALADRWGAAYTVGFVLAADDDIFCLDIDSVLLPDSTWRPEALQILAMLPDTAVEVSQSGRGLHIWGRGRLPPHAKRKTVLGIPCELYSGLRFLARGTGANGDMTRPCATIEWFAREFFPPDTGAGADVPETGPCPEWRGPTDDDELIARMCRMRSGAVFGGRATANDLWTANVEALARAYPPDDPSTRPYDRSKADAALAQHLAYYTGRDVARIARLMRRSALAREKWERDDYFLGTIRNACARQVQVLQDRPFESPPASVPAPLTNSVEQPAMRAVQGDTYANAEQQAKLFAGCVYILNQHRALIPGGRILKPEQFKARFGGYTWAMDSRNERTTRDAWEAFTQSQLWRAPHVDDTCFRPDLPPTAIVREGGSAYVNTWSPIDVRRTPGDASPFLEHLGRLLPVESDRVVMLHYLANMVQLSGVKFQWAPLLVGAEGNGKTFFSHVIEHAVGTRYVHWLDASKLGERFNGWMVGKLAYLVEDVRVGSRFDILEKLKPMITGNRAEIEGKGADQVTGGVCGNFIFNSNHKDAIRKTANDRRYAPLWCAQHEAADLERDGLTQDYFAHLYAWANGGGYAIVAEYLHAFAIPPDFGRTWVCGRAPTTSSTADAIEATRSPAERAVLAAIEDGRPGFAGGFVSSMFLRRLIDALPRDARPAADLKSLMAPLGYVPHPALPKGQTNNRVTPDHGRPVLYVKRDSEAARIERPVTVEKEYMRLQTSGPCTYAPLHGVGTPESLRQ